MTEGFFKRWGEGIKKVTPMQTIKVNLTGMLIILAGIVLGLVTTFYYKQWWIFVILVGSLIVQGLSFIGSIQKYLTFKHIETMTKEVENNEHKS